MVNVIDIFAIIVSIIEQDLLPSPPNCSWHYIASGQHVMQYYVHTGSFTVEDFGTTVENNVSLKHTTGGAGAVKFSKTCNSMDRNYDCDCASRPDWRLHGPVDFSEIFRKIDMGTHAQSFSK